MRKRRWVAVIASLTLVLAACSSSEVAERIIESQEGVGDVEIDQSGGTVQIEVQDDEGDVSAVIGGGDIPEDFPIDVPGGGKVQAVVQQQADTTVALIYEGGNYDSIQGFFEDWVSSSGGEVANKFESSTPKSTAWTVQVGDQAYTITVVETGADIQVNLFVTGT